MYKFVLYNKKYKIKYYFTYYYIAIFYLNIIQKLYIVFISALTKVLNILKQKNNTALYTRVGIKPRILNAKIRKKSQNKFK